MTDQSKLGLGGHSFIGELGNDPPASFEKQCEIVAACLDNRIRLLDTTYYRERVALGEILQTLGRRNDAEVMAWNFFKQPGKENELVGFTPYEPHHIETILDELQTDCIDILVIHVHDNAHKLHREMELAKRWMSEGRLKRIALGMAQPVHLLELPADHAVTHVLAPYNAFHQKAKEMFVMAKQMGLTTIALSPFVRGWKLDEIGEDKQTAADILLRWVTDQELIDRVIVSMRKPEWVHSNVRTIQKGPLTGEEYSLLNDWVTRLG